MSITQDAREARDVMEWRRMLQLVDMKDTLLVRLKFPCPRLVESSVGLTVDHVRQWFAVYLQKINAPIVCLRTGACFNYQYTAQYGTLGSWIVTLALKDGTHISEKTGAVRKLVKRFKADALQGSQGTVLLHIVCRHRHINIVKRL